jgi:hypothetical protein
MSSFALVADHLITLGGAVTCEPDALAAVLAKLMNDLYRSREMGEKGKDAVATLTKVAPLIASNIASILKERLKPTTESGS